MSEHEVPNPALPTRYFDTLKEAGDSPGDKVILLPLTGMSDVSGQTRNAILTANEAGEKK